MQNLTEQALQKARRTIAENFADPDALDGLGVLSHQLEKQLIAAESQLSNAVQSKLDSLKRAVDLMDESTLKLTKLSTNISRIDEKIAQTNTAISNYDHLKKVDNARENLSKVISQVEFFARVPERVEFLREKMDSSPASLKDVFLEAVKLESLRVALMKEIQVTRNRRISIGTCLSEDANDQLMGKIRSAVMNHLRIVPDLMDEVTNRVMGNIGRMFDLAADNPQDLVMSFEILEMQHEYNERRNVAMRNALKNKTLNSVQQHEYDNIHSVVETKMRHMLDEKVEGDFELVNLSNELEDSKITALTSLILASNQVLQKITVFKQDVVPCIPTHYEPLFVFLESFEFVLLPRIDECVQNVGDLKVSEILDFINWIEYHNDCVSRFGFPERECLAHLYNTKVELMLEYKERIKNQVIEWFDNIKKQPLELNKNTNGLLVTPNPEDMFNIIHAQLEVAREKLPLEYTKEVAIACLQVLQSVQRDAYDNLSHHWQDMAVDTMCALINDNQRMREKCDEFGEHVLRFVEEGADKEMIAAILVTVSEEYARIAVKAVNSLAKCVLLELDDSIFLKIYGPEWESGENLSNILIVTLADYFQDLSTWLPADYFKVFVRELMIFTADKYLMYLRKKSNGTFTFTSELNAANRVLNDKLVIQEFFETHMVVDDTQSVEGVEEEDFVRSNVVEVREMRLFIESHFEPMIHLACVISARHPSGVGADVRALYQRWGIDGLRLVQAALLANPSVNKTEKATNIDAAKKMFDGGDRNGAPFSNKPNEEFASYDTGTLSAEALAKAVAKANQPQKKGFWGRSSNTTTASTKK
eukprot:gene10614-12394_t